MLRFASETTMCSRMDKCLPGFESKWLLVNDCFIEYDSDICDDMFGTFEKPGAKEHMNHHIEPIAYG